MLAVCVCVVHTMMVFINMMTMQFMWPMLLGGHSRRVLASDPSDLATATPSKDYSPLRTTLARNAVS